MVRQKPAFGYIYQLATESQRMLDATKAGDTETMAEILEITHNTESPLVRYSTAKRWSCPRSSPLCILTEGWERGQGVLAGSLRWGAYNRKNGSKRHEYKVEVLRQRLENNQ